MRMGRQNDKRPSSKPGLPACLARLLGDRPGPERDILLALVPYSAGDRHVHKGRDHAVVEVGASAGRAAPHANERCVGAFGLGARLDGASWRELLHEATVIAS